MAKDIIEIEFKATGNKPLVKAIEKLDEATKSLVKSQSKLVTEGKKVKDVQEKLNKTTKKTIDRTRILGGTVAVLRSKILLFNFALGFAIRAMGKFASQSAKVDSMRTAFNTLSDSGEGAGIALNRLKKATNDTMSEFDLFQQANNAMVLGVSQNSDEMAEMFDIAQRLGRALGRDTASSVESLVTGIGRQSRLMLDNIGIIVKSEEAYKKYAKELGKTSDKLTDAEKKQAFLEATMESARAKVAQLGDELPTTQDKLDQLATSSVNFSTAIGNTLSPAISGLSVKTSSLLNDLTSLLNIFNHNKSATLEYYEALEGGKKLVEELSKSLEIKVDPTLSIESQLKSLQNQSRELAKDGFFQGIWGNKFISASAKITESLKRITRTTKDYNAQFLPSVDVVPPKPTPDDTFSPVGIDKEEESRFKNLEKMLELSASARKTVFKDSIDFQIAQLDVLESQFLINNEHNLESETYFAEQRKAIYDKEREERIANEIEIASKIKQGFDFVTSEYQKNVERRRDNEIQALQDSLAYEQATNEARKTMEKNVKKEFAKEEKRLFMMKKMSTVAQIVLDTASAMTEALPNVPLSLAIGALGTIQQGIALATPPPKYEQGGLVGGRRHSQGGTMIEAERGEFVMSRSAVESIGTETLNQMNQGGTGGITLNISAPLVDETIIDTIIPAIHKAQKMDLA